MPQVISVLQPILQNIYQAKTLEEAKILMISLIDSTRIKDIDKKKMRMETENCRTLVKLQFYATNAMFKYEGLSVNSVIYN